MAKLGGCNPESMVDLWPLITGNAAKAVALAGRGQITSEKIGDIV